MLIPAEGWRLNTVPPQDIQDRFARVCRRLLVVDVQINQFHAHPIQRVTSVYHARCFSRQWKGLQGADYLPGRRLAKAANGGVTHGLPQNAQALDVGSSGLAAYQAMQDLDLALRADAA